MSRIGLLIMALLTLGVVLASATQIEPNTGTNERLKANNSTGPIHPATYQTTFGSGTSGGFTNANGLGPKVPVSFTVGGGDGWMAQTSTLIGTVYGTFPTVSGLKSESDSGGGGGNYYSLQLNTNIFFNCDTVYTGGPATWCWEQFIFESCPGVVSPCGADSGSPADIFIEYVIAYPSSNGSCPTTSIPGGTGWRHVTSDNSCHADSGSTGLGLTVTELITNLSHLTLWGTAASDGDAILLGDSSTGKTWSYTTSLHGSGSVLNLYANWNQAEFNVFGFGNGSQADFNSGTFITVDESLLTSAGAQIQPACLRQGETGETNNLSLGPCWVLPNNHLEFSESLGLATTSVATAVFDASTNTPWSASETTGASAYDTATVAGGPTAPTGTVTYTFYANGACSGSGSSAGTVTLTTNGSVPNSNTVGPLAVGSYSFQAVYSGDGNYAGSASSCEPMTVKASTTTRTSVFDATTNAAWSGGEVGGASAYDTASVTTSGTVVATGTVSYAFFTNGACSGSGTSAGIVTLTSSGGVPNSNTEGPLAAGSYSLRAVYSGDTHYGGSTSPCEQFGVGLSSTASVVFDASTNARWSGSEVGGASAYDTATVTVSGTIVATGTVVYTFYTNGGCTGTGASAGTVTLTSVGAVPKSNTEGSLAPGIYSFRAVYSGDTKYVGSTSPCEPFTVGASSVSTVVFDASTSSPWSFNETIGASAYDTATVTVSGTIVATGTVVYTFYTNGVCSGSGSPAGTVLLTSTGAVLISNTEGRLDAGFYSFRAVYSGDTHYTGSTSPCEQFSIAGGSSKTATVVFDASTRTAWSGSEVGGAYAYDTATVTTSDAISATGTASYTFYTNGACSGTGVTESVTLYAGSSVPSSSTHGPLAPGSYSFRAAYSNDPYHVGSASSCEPFTVGASSVSTVVFDASTFSAWSGSEVGGASAYDTATVNVNASFVYPTGTIVYTFYTNGACSGTGVTESVTLYAGSSVPSSSTHGPLAPGSYSFQAVYSGDSHFVGSTSPCEPFTVGASSVSTVVFDASTFSAWSGSEVGGASAYDTATVTTSGTVVATGTVSYAFFTNGACSGTGVTESVTLYAGSSVPSSSTHGPLAPGSYSFRAVYSGDSHFVGSTSPCEPFIVTGTATVVFDASTNLAWSGSETTGTSAYDAATMSTSGTLVATGTVSYTFYTNGGCTGAGSTAGTVLLMSTGAVPISNTDGPLAAGSYSFRAVYSGDTNYAGSTSPCEPFSVNIGPSATSTTVFDASTNAPWSGSEVGGASAYDTGTVSGVPGVTPTGTVSYTFYTNGGCTGTGASAGTVTLTSVGAVPKSNTEGSLAPGLYSFRAVYSGDTNYTGSTSLCEPFSLGISSVSTVVFDASTFSAWSGSEVGGASAYDTATVTTSGTVVATGTVVYTFYTTGVCSGAGSTAGTVLLTSTGAVPTSNIEGPLAAGSYSFQAVYAGDSHYLGSSSPCEPFSLGISSIATVLFDASTTSRWSGSETTGASAYDTATVATSGTVVATGTVSYTFYTNGVCSGAGSSAGTVTLTASGGVPISNIEGPLAAGSYSFRAVYLGDSHYAGSTSPCEPFNVVKGSSSTATVVFDASTTSPWSGSETTGASAYDKANVGAGPFAPTGTVTYTFYTNGGCSGSHTTQTVPLSGGTVPNSAPTSPLVVHNYSFQATYSGDSNYSPSTGPCESFSVNKGSPTTATVAFDASTNAAWSGSETTGASAYDTATVSGASGINPSGNVVYTLFKSGCFGNVVSTQTVSLSGGAVPNSNPTGKLAAGSYAFQASYSGDPNYNGSTSSCEPFSVGMVSTGASTSVVRNDNGASVPLFSSVPPGTSVHDTACNAASEIFTSPNGNSWPQSVLMSSGAVPPSQGTGPLAAGNYGFQAVYSGDSNYLGSTSPCEPFIMSNTSTSTSVVRDDNGASVPLFSSVPLGTPVHDTATVVKQVSGPTPGGSVTYHFYSSLSHATLRLRSSRVRTVIRGRSLS